ncbi:Hypothetical Protein FCC1311_103022 [Hondaea fermentalgiana]|uniref:FAM13A-like domain-containing protein n=1 Tax=Hondaea fermentalgiana TaxID=2315210 RepID=A0A2R5GUT2_9STRA|nr:Hypothetical Protein FCC1311_103022 [Hondaea fermentalgiana]|eukprot:GBG34079.1 Hypothetical Protein FCC1311_103022 [Hondaea fermentalgiana]
MARSPFRVDAAAVEAETSFVVEACLARIEMPAKAPASDLLAPQVPVTEVAELLSDLLYSRDDRNADEGKNDATRGLPRVLEPAFAAGVLWLHLRRRQLPLFPFDVFQRMTVLALDLEPLEDLEDAYTDAYADAVREALTLADLRDLVMRLAVDNRHNLHRVLHFVAVAMQKAPKLTSLEAMSSVGPILAKPRDTTFMSIRHRRELGLARHIMSALLDHLDDLDDAWTSDEAPLDPAKADTLKTSTESPAPLLTSSPGLQQNKRKAAAGPAGSLSPSTGSRGERKGSVSKTLEAVATEAQAASRRPLSIVTVDEKIFPAPEQPKLAISVRDESSHINLEQANKLIDETVHRLCLGETSWMRFVRVPAASMASPVPLASKSIVKLGSPESTFELKKRNSGKAAHLAMSQPQSEQGVTENGPSRRDPDALDRAESVPSRLPDPIISKSASEGRLEHANQRMTSKNSTEPASSGRGNNGNQDEEKQRNRANESIEERNARNGVRGRAKSEGSGRSADDAEERDAEERETVTPGALRARLEGDKRALKARLKRFDEDFFRVHGRKPVRLDKEPIRHLYEEYNALKRRINELGMGNGDDKFREASSLRSRSGSEGSMDAHSHDGGPQRGGQPRSIETLLGEKRALQTQLREFERKFEIDNKRKIRCAADIKGLEREYRRYKELKETLASLQVGQTASPSRSPRFVQNSPLARG